MEEKIKSISSHNKNSSTEKYDKDIEEIICELWKAKSEEKYYIIWTKPVISYIYFTLNEEHAVEMLTHNSVGAVFAFREHVKLIKNHDYYYELEAIFQKSLSK